MTVALYRHKLESNSILAIFTTPRIFSREMVMNKECSAKTKTSGGRTSTENVTLLKLVNEKDILC